MDFKVLLKQGGSLHFSSAEHMVQTFCLLVTDPALALVNWVCILLQLLRRYDFQQTLWLLQSPYCDLYYNVHAEGN